MGKMHEIDVVTDIAYQRRGIGKIVAARFVKECEKKSLIPSWDCFQENLGSINLAKSVGFSRSATEYNFYFYKKELSVPTA
jgi:L-amino acid N-acyltransferase YncA